MPNPLAKTILNNIVKKEMKHKPQSSSHTATDRLSNREEELLTKLIHNKVANTHQGGGIPTVRQSRKAITLDALLARCVRRDQD